MAQDEFDPKLGRIRDARRSGRYATPLSCSGRPESMVPVRVGNEATSRRPRPSAAWVPVCARPQG